MEQDIFIYFDRLSAELAVIKHKFSVVALAKTNTDECNKYLYKLSNEYTPVYSSKIENKVKVSGVALRARPGSRRSRDPGRDLAILSRSRSRPGFCF